MLEINNVLKRNNLVPKKYLKVNDIYIVETNKGKKIIKKHNTNIYEYLISRNFNYFLPFKLDNDYEIIDYIDEIKLPDEQKLLDLIKLVSLLHNKTTFYKEIDIDDYKKIYEDILNNINYLENYYNGLINNIDSKIYMSPSEYYLALNISKIFSAINYSKKEINNWYNLVKEKTKTRYVVLNNDLRLENFIESDSKYIVNWDKSYYGIPIFDIYNLYIKYANKFDFESLLKVYEKEYPLKEDEKKILFILVSLPKPLSNSTEYEKSKDIYNIITYLDKTDKLILPYYSNNTEDNKQK